MIVMYVLDFCVSVNSLLYHEPHAIKAIQAPVPRSQMPKIVITASITCSNTKTQSLFYYKSSPLLMYDSYKSIP